MSMQRLRREYNLLQMICCELKITTKKAASHQATRRAGMAGAANE